MDPEVAKILEAAEVMRKSFLRLGARRGNSLTEEQHLAVEKAANSFNFLQGIRIAQLRAAFDPEYKEKMNQLTRLAKGENGEKNN